MVERAIDELRSKDHFSRMFNTGLLANARPDLSEHIIGLILEIDQEQFSAVDSIRALFTVVGGLSGISASQMLEILSRWPWTTSGIGSMLGLNLNQLAET